MKLSETKQMLRGVQEMLSYTDEEMKMFLSDKRNLEFLKRVPDLLGHTFRFRVVLAHGCACRHAQGQHIAINGDGSINHDACPERTCIYLLQALVPMVFAAQEFVYSGLEPEKITFRHAGCFDTGVMCGGLGNVAVEMVFDEGEMV